MIQAHSEIFSFLERLPLISENVSARLGELVSIEAIIDKKSSSLDIFYYEESNRICFGHRVNGLMLYISFEKFLELIDDPQIKQYFLFNLDLFL